MSLPVVLRDEARAEFDDAFDWYDAQRAGLGAEFVAEVQKTFDRIASNPLPHRTVFADIRRVGVRRFRTACTIDRTRIGSKSSQCFTAAATRQSGKAGPDLPPESSARPARDRRGHGKIRLHDRSRMAGEH